MLKGGEKMNTVSFQPQKPVAKQSQLKGNVGNRGQSPFQSLLNQTMKSGQAQVQVGIGKNTQNTRQTEQPIINDETLQIMSDADMGGVISNILTLLEGLAEEIPFADGYLNLTDPIKGILEELPDEIKSVLVVLFQSNISIEELLKNVEQSGATHELIAAFIFFNELQTAGKVQLSTTQQQALTYQIQQFVDRASDELPAEVKQLINRFLQQTNEQVQSSKQNQTTNFVPQSVLSQQKTSSQGLSLQTFGHDQTVMSRTQQMVIHVGEQLTKEAEQHQFQRQFQDMMNRGLFRNLQNGLNQLSIKLYPEHLGRLDIQITQMNGIITARIMASTQVAKELIEGQLQNLRQAFVHQQLQVERIEVTQQEEGPLYQSARDEQNKEQQNQRAKDGQNKENQEDHETFSELLEEFTYMEKV